MKLLFWLTLTANLLLELYAALNLLLGDAGLLADTGQNACPSIMLLPQSP